LTPGLPAHCLTGSVLISLVVMTTQREMAAQTRFRRGGFIFGIVCVGILLVSALPCPTLQAKDQKAGKPAVRWKEGDPDCTLTKGDDGIYRYSMGYETLLVTLAVDNQELEKTKRNLRHVFPVLLTLRNRGTVPIQFGPEGVTLELVEHYHLRMPSLDPDDFSSWIQEDADELVHQSERELKKHPERKEVVEARLKEHEKVVSEWQEYMTTKALRDVTLDAGQTEVTGAVIFRTRTKWKGDWKREENFVLRIPLDNVVLEFPFTLPPRGEGPELRHRPDQE
jgi:hypothetical protein